MTAPVRYPVRTRILHWLTAVLVFSTLFIGFVMVTSLGSYASLRGVHMTLGVVVLAIVAVRAANRFTHRVPKLPDTVGWVVLSASGRPAVVFGFLALPPIAPFDSDLYFVLRQTHSLLAYALVAVIAAHVSGVLLHTLTLRDGMLSRMTVGLRRQPPRRRQTVSSADTPPNSANLRTLAPAAVHPAIRECTSPAPNTRRHGWTGNHG